MTAENLATPFQGLQGHGDRIISYLMLDGSVPRGGGPVSLDIASLCDKSSILLMQGEISVLPEGLDFYFRLAEKHPSLNIELLSNGLMFDEKWRQATVRYAHSPVFILHAASPADYAKIAGYKKAGHDFEKIIKNIEALVELQHQSGLQCLAPAVSMAVNRKNSHSVREFVKLGLKCGARAIYFHIDDGDVHERSLQEIIALERVLRGRVFVGLRLAAQSREITALQCQIDAENLELIMKEYSDVLDLSQGRRIFSEIGARNHKRKHCGLSELSLGAELKPYFYERQIGQMMRDGAFQAASIRHNGNVDLFKISSPILSEQKAVIVDDFKENFQVSHFSLAVQQARDALCYGRLRRLYYIYGLMAFLTPGATGHRFKHVRDQIGRRLIRIGLAEERQMIAERRALFLRYYACRLLSNIAFGRRRKKLVVMKKALLKSFNDLSAALMLR